MQHKLEIYIADDCPTCAETRYLIATLRQKNYTNLTVDLLNLSNPDTIYPDNVFATPTFVLNGRVISLGNPSWAELSDCIRKEGVYLIE